jgi:hypothetical protein
MSTLERELLRQIEEFKAEHNGKEPRYVCVNIRWKDTGKVERRIVALFPYDEENTPDFIDDRVFFYFDLPSNIFFCMSNVEDVDGDDYDDIEDFEEALNLYAETPEDREYYFPSKEDFDIVTIREVMDEIF